MDREMQDPYQYKSLIPFDCEFILIQPKNKTIHLTEIYSVNRKIFSFDFGTWAKDSNLIASNVNFYRRRMNFQRSKINVLSARKLVRSKINETSIICL